jgi:hypothetical protein
MICSLQNKSTVTLLADLTDGTEKMLEPGQLFLYEDTTAYPTDGTWQLVELGLLEDKDHEDGFRLYKLWYDVIPPTHNWALEGF